MIESISLGKVATYGDTPESLSQLAQINFIFGTNGTGKTTISRVIADEFSFPSCNVRWKNGQRLQPLVYNRDFVQRNFSPSAELRGVFTLGERQAHALDEIKAKKQELDSYKEKRAGTTKALEGEDGKGGKKGELNALEDSFQEQCWAAYTQHKSKLSHAFEGVRNSKKDFKARVLKEASTNTAQLVPLAELETRAGAIFGQTPTMEAAVSSIDFSTLIAYEATPILRKRVIGKEDVDIAAMIQKLGNSDWVREGRSFYDANDRVCPFCQQQTSEAFEKSLSEYFNEAFEKDSSAIADLLTNYKTEASRIQQAMEQILAAPSRFLVLEKFRTEKELLDTKIALNIQQLVKKAKEPSQIVELESIGNVAGVIGELIKEANTHVSKHNATVKNLTQERSRLTAEVWKHVLETDLKLQLDSYQTQRNSLQNAITGMEGRVQGFDEEIRKRELEIRGLEKLATSIQPTIDAINGLLTSFGFHGFLLAKADNGTSYKLVRPDSSDAKETLSEGEKTFVTFLYFYHLLKGSNSESGITTDRIVVFDDPVSSLDSDILFIVGSLIKKLFGEVRDGRGYVKQVFVLTHNVYFHKEVSFNKDRPLNGTRKDETFWVVRKPEQLSRLERHPTNPVRTSYELLWSEVKNTDRSLLTIQNVLRRILENYFKFFGNIDPRDICSKFSGRDQMICNSLLSWVNDGSHYAHDDLYVSIDRAMVESYLRVFRQIFFESGHEAHYKMMMGEAFEEADSVLKEVQAASRAQVAAAPVPAGAIPAVGDERKE